MPVAERGTISTTWAHQKWRRASHRRWSGEKKSSPESFRSKRIIGDERSQEIHVEATWRAETLVNRL